MNYYEKTLKFIKDYDIALLNEDRKLQTIEIEYGWFDYEESEQHTIIINYQNYKLTVRKCGYSVFGDEYDNEHTMTFSFEKDLYVNLVKGIEEYFGND